MVLEGLDTINWSELTHAYGTASDVPILLRSLLSPSEEAVENSLQKLFGAIWHQGTVYEATGYAVPFLIELLTLVSLVVKPEILNLLAVIAHGSSNLAAHQHLDSYYHERNTEAFQATMRQEIEWAAAAHDAVEQGTAVYLSLLEHEDTQTATMAAFLLARCRDHADTVLPALVVVLGQETRVSVKVSAIYASAALLNDAPKDQDSSSAPYLSIIDVLSADVQESPYVRLAALFALLELKGANAIEPALVGFARWGALCKEPLDTHLPWSFGDNVREALSDALKPYPYVHMGWLLTLLYHPDFSETAFRESVLWQIVEVSRQSRSATHLAVPYFVRLLTDEDLAIREWASTLLPQLGQTTRCVIPSLKVLQKYADSGTRKRVTEIFSALQKMDETIARTLQSVPPTCEPVKVLLTQLQQTLLSGHGQQSQANCRALRCIDYMGGVTREDLPLFRALLGNESRIVRVYAARILWSLGESADAILPVLLESLHADPDGYLALEGLEKMGGAAYSAIPNLRAIVESDTRWIETGTVNTWNATDDAFLEVAQCVLHTLETTEPL